MNINVGLPAATEHAPGIYFSMPESEYFADPALGSTDMKRLAYSPCDYWFESSHNPMRVQKEPTPAQLFGRAVHKFVLEGRDLFESLYAPTDFSGSTKDGKAERKAIEDAGKTPIKRDDWTQICSSGAMIRSNPYLAEAFSGGMSEVSIFWEDAGLRKKCRIDYLKPRASVDLKSIRNSRNIDFREACRRALAEYRYDAQAEHYDHGRAAARALIADGAVHGDHDPEWLRRVAGASEWAFVFVFYQADGAPLTYGVSLSPANGLRDIARTTLRIAEQNYREHVARFGFDLPWVLAEPLEEIDINSLPAWAFRI